MINLRNVHVSELWSMFMFFFWNLLLFFRFSLSKLRRACRIRKRIVYYPIMFLFFIFLLSHLICTEKHIHIIDFLSANKNRFSAASASPAMSAKGKLICYLINVMSEFFLEYAVEYSRYYNLLSLFWLRIGC